MSPPTEQLIRDYLNRLSVAARDRLGPDDRRALLDRTRKLIERKSDFAGRPTTMEVGKVLARLGDPVALVEQEFRRLAAVRGGLPGGAPDAAGAPQLAGSADSWELAEPAEPASRRGFRAWVRRHERGRAWRSGLGWPTAEVIENGTFDATAAAPAAPAATSLTPPWPSAVAPDRGAAPYPPSDLPVRNGTIVSAGTTPADPGRKQAGDAPAAAANGTSSGTGANGISTANGIDTASGTAAFDAETGDEFEMPPHSIVSRVVRLFANVASAAWQQPLEATAIILLGLGGVIFPPVFVLGALVALGSKSWHYRDKWVGLVLPPLLTIIAAAAGIAVGGTSHGLHDAWVALNIVSRVAALLGAGYLAWRMGAGRRPPPQPPWHKPHRATGS
jgi:hypothetical protein